MAKKIQKETREYTPVVRSSLALNALSRKVWKKGNDRKEANRKACRGKVQW